MDDDKIMLLLTGNSVDSSEWTKYAYCTYSGQVQVLRVDRVLQRPAM